MTSPSDDARKLPTDSDESTSVAQATRRLFALLDKGEKRRFFWLIPAVTGMALLQVVGIASILPFLALVTDPTIVETNKVLSTAYDLLGFQSTNSFLVFAGAAALALLVISNAFTALTEYLLLRYSWHLNHSLSVRLLREYVAKPYVFFVDRNSAALATNILSETKQAVRGFVLAALNLMSRSVVALFILALLIGLYPVLAILTFGILGTAYGVTFMLVKRGMAESGRQRSRSDRARHQAAFEVLGGIKDIKILGRERPFLLRFQRHSRNYERQMAKAQVIALLPRYAFETIAFGGMLMIVLVLLLRGEAVQQIVPTLGVFAFATLRLLPALQSLFTSLTSLRFSVTAVDVIYRDITPGGDVHIENRDGIVPQPFKQRLELDSIDFTYPKAKGPVLRGFSLRVDANSTVGIVGPTGSGKTTTVDLLLGLLEPQDGALKVDGVVIDDSNRSAWQSNLGYVPQQIYLADDTIAANIAFGVRARDVDMQAVERAARLANVHEFIVTELPDGYDTAIGERGVRLSGGQRQRLGIARALYHNPAVLVFDEATSALDGVTEESIFRAVGDLGKSKTIIMIAHRMTTVRECDVIYLLEKGKVTARGSYDGLIATNATFRAMARAGSPDDVVQEPATIR